MLKRIADETVIHGVKEAWYANRIGRVFYAIVFTICFVLMFFQLRGLFQAYFNQRVGTKLTSPTTLDHAEVPSFYYCNDMWFPNLLGVNELSRSEDGIPKSITDTKLAVHVKTLRENDTVYPIDNYWLAMRVQDLINGIMMLPDNGRFDVRFRSTLRPDERSVAFYARAHRELVKMQEKLIGSSLKQTVQDMLDGSPQHDESTPSTVMNQTHGIFPKEVSLYDSLHEAILKQGDRLGNPRLTLDGICWEFSPGPIHQRTKQVIGEKHQHVVTHFGGLGRQWAKLVLMYLTSPGQRQGTSPLQAFRQETSSLDNYRDAVYVAMTKVLQYVIYFKLAYVTYVSIATQEEPHLYFDQKIRIDSYSPRVLIKYWTKRSVFKSRKAWPCRSKWTTLDQAHCNQRYAKEMGDLFCEQYLPASDHFKETGITRKTCTHDHTGLFELGKSAARKQNTDPRIEYPLQVSSTSREQMLLNLTANSIRCPRPCSQTLFQFETTYPTAAISETSVQCQVAVSYFLVPSEDIHEMWWGDQLLRVGEQFNQSEFKVFMYDRALILTTQSTNGDGTKMMDWPCSVVEYERSEANGLISEEYFLYSLSDLAANLGGIVGLWAGASVLSIVQIIHLCCSKKLLKRIKLLFRCLIRCVRRPGKGSGSENSEHSQCGSNKAPHTPAVSLNRVQTV